MGLFNKKKPVVIVDYSKWESDLGFLHSIMGRKLELVVKFNMGVFKSQLQDGLIRDEDMHEFVESIVLETIKLLSPAYKEFLVTKYFNTESMLIAYISEDVFANISTAGISTNLDILKKRLDAKSVEKMLSSVNIETEKAE